MGKTAHRNGNGKVKFIFNLALRDGPLCRYCYIHFKDNLDENISIDHLVPQHRGGARSRYDNLGLSCKRCNEAKGYLTEEEFLKFIETGDEVPYFQFYPAFQEWNKQISQRDIQRKRNHREDILVTRELWKDVEYDTFHVRLYFQPRKVES